jgi:magnesium transporter
MLRLFPPSAKTATDAIWVDLCDPTEAEIKQTADALSIDMPQRDELEEIESSRRLQFENGVLQLSLPVSAHEGEEAPTPVGFLLAEKFLVTIRYTRLEAFEVAAQQCSKANEPLMTSAAVFGALIEGMVEYGADLLEEIATQLNDVSKDVFRRYGRSRQHNVSRVNRKMRESLVAVGMAGEQLSQIREAILGMQRVVPFAVDKGKAWIGQETAENLKTAIADLQSLSDFEVHLSNKVQFLLDAVLGFINTEQNDIFKVLTIASVVGIPPTFIASMYGMNFHNMPEYSWAWGYQWGLFLIVVSTVLPIIWFKWRGWW